jgi:ribosomal protein L31E
MKLIYTKVNNQIWKQVRYQVYGVLRVRLEEQVEEQVNEQVSNRVSNRLTEQVIEQLIHQVNERVYRQMSFKVEENISL